MRAAPNERRAGERWIVNPVDPNPIEHDAESYVVTHEASEKFIELIQEERRSGYGFVPIIGAGFSAPSGAPLVYELKPYLQRCIWLALGNKDLLRTQSQDWYRWHPRTDQWPPFQDRDQNKNRPNYLTELWKRLVELLPDNASVSREEKREIPVVQQGIGAMAEWRTALLFLSRLKHEARGRGYPRSSLGAARQEIVDACLREVLKGKYPSLNHTMLGVLAGALRLNLILTTNFDDLLERAFAEAKNPLQVFEVHLGDNLPHWSAVSDVRSLVKFHGNRHSLRADYSLDADPSDQDKVRFLEYLQAGRGRAEAHTEGKHPFQNHLLVMGVSGDDRRTLELMKYAGQNLDDDFKIFWLCYNDEDISNQESGIRAFARDYCHSTKRKSDGLVVLKHTNYGLLLLQLYQTIRRNLPPFGGLFPSVSRLTLPPLRSKPDRNGAGKSFSAALVDRLKRLNEDGEHNVARLIVATAADQVRGMTSACIEAFCQLETRNVCLWLDMNDISRTDNLFEVLLEATYRRLGQENWVPTYRETDTERRIRELALVMSTVDKPWIIFLNARETPGANTGETVFDDPHYPHGWLDRRDCNEDKSSCSVAFVHLIMKLCEEQSPRISVVLMCRSPRTPDGLPTGLMAELGIDGKKQPERFAHVRLEKGMREVNPFSEDQVVASAIKWTRGQKDRKRFLHALVLMQRPRFLSIVWSDAVLLEGEEDEVKGDERYPDDAPDIRQVWLNQLEKIKLLRRKAGGFIWLHSRCRERIRQVLWQTRERQDKARPKGRVQEILAKWDAKSDEPEIHSKLAKWYEKVLDASEAPGAVFEALHHLCKAAERYLERHTGAGDREDLQAACQRLEAASALLRANSFLIQTHGYARGSCRRLNHIRNVLCISLAAQPLRKEQDRAQLQGVAQKLRVTCTEVMRAIAREVGEDKKAYIRHQQFAMLQTQAQVALLSEPEGKHFVGEGRISHRLLEALRGSDGEGGPAADVPALRRGKASQGGTDAQADWVRWWRWSGMLATATGSYHSATEAFEKALQCVAFPLEYPALPQPVWPIEDTKQTKARVYESDSQELRVEALRVVEQYVELLLLQYGLDQRLSGLGEPPSPDFRARLVDIEKLVRRGRDLASKIRGRDHSPDSRHTADANWCESRLLIHQSVCTSRWRQLGIKKPVFSPMGLLGDAEAILRTSDPRRHRSDLATVELHRAQARLWGAEAVIITPGTPGESLVEMCRRLDGRLREEHPHYHPDRVRADFLGKGADSALRKAKALVVDGIHFLDRVEPMLRERRRNVWWTTWFFERYLRSIALSVWASVFEEGTPIPFLGLEAAASGTATVADDLLDNAKRMISVDTYRMAMIVDAYASCARALQVRLLLDEKSGRLRSRPQKMGEKLKEALVELEQVVRRRNDSASVNKIVSTEVHRNIDKYVYLVGERAKSISKGLDPG